MRWKIATFVFCEKQQRLSNKEQDIQLEPLVVELLAYFCQNPNQIVSRDQLINDVWQGRFITDNAVTKVVTKLRKHFADDARQPRFIATYPKKGYKFIADVSEWHEPLDDIEQEIIVKPSESTKPNPQSHAPKVRNPPQNKWLGWGVFIALITIGLAVWQHAPSSLLLTQVKALTRSAGNDAWPQISLDKKYMTYMVFNQQSIQLWVKSLTDEKRVQIQHKNSPNLGYGPAAYNSDGSQIVYLAASQNICQYYIRDINGLTLGEPKLIHNCPAGSYGRISFTHDDKMVVYAERDNSPYSLFAMDLTTGAKRRLNQPELVLGGNSQFDLHPTDNKLLISSPDKQQWEGYYALDLDTDELTLLFKQDAYICCGIWDHTGTRVVLMGEHPAYQLVSYDLNGKDQQLIYSGSQQLRSPLRHVNGQDYLFVSRYSNQNVLYYDFAKQTENTLVNTSVDDRLAVYSAKARKVAYVGLSTGKEEIWITDLTNGQPSKLTSFQDSRHILAMAWSPTGEYLAVMGLNQIYLVNSTSGKAELLKIPQVEIRAMSWKNAKQISYSTKQNNQWQVNYYDIDQHSVSYENTNWAFIQYAENPEDSLWQNQRAELFYGAQPAVTPLGPVTNNAEAAKGLMLGRHFAIKKLAETWAWQVFSDGKYQLYIQTSANQPIKQVASSQYTHFDLFDQGLLYHRSENASADIFSTVSGKD
ncbi:winged helix-turn-helix domain-containing protein [Paraglaciecola aestuariivivens]